MSQNFHCPKIIDGKQCNNDWFIQPTKTTSTGLPVLRDERYAYCIKCGTLYGLKMSGWREVDRIIPDISARNIVWETYSAEERRVR